jgi:hypothetical protein
MKSTRKECFSRGLQVTRECLRKYDMYEEKMWSVLEERHPDLHTKPLYEIHEIVKQYKQDN